MFCGGVHSKFFTVSGNTTTNALYRAIHPDITDVELLKKLKWALPLFALFGYAITFAGGIYDLLVFAGAALFPTISASYILGMFWKKANHKGALASFYGGLASWLVFTFAWILPSAIRYSNMEGWEDAPLHMFRDFAYLVESGYVEDAVYIAAVPAFIFSCLALVVVSLATQKSDPPKAAVDADGVSLDTVSA